MSISVLLVETPDCCELCRFISYEPMSRCSVLPYRISKINDRLNKLVNCPLRALPERKEIIPLNAESYVNGWNECIDELLTENRKGIKGHDK